MLTRLQIKNYQSIKEADIELAPFTVIVGQNRSGKSATLRAIRALFFNQTGTGFIRRGQNNCEVIVDTDDHQIIWYKNKTTAEYDLDGRRFTKLAGGVPEEIQAALGVRAIEVDSTLTLTPQVHIQGEWAFLLDRSAGQAARALAKMTRLDVVVKAQQLCKSAIRSIRDDLKVATAGHDQAQKELEEFEDTEELGKTHGRLTRVIKGISEDYGVYEFATELVPALEVADVALPTQEDIDFIKTSAAALLEASEFAPTVAKLIPTIPDVRIDELNESIDRLVEGMNEAADYDEAMYESSGEELSALQHTMDKCKKELDAVRGEECPVCGGKL